jgi:ParB family chromosome partitioning protein
MTASATQLKSVTVRLKDLDIAPENPRFLEGPDDQIPDLATSLAPDAAGLLVPLLVRAGGKKEKPFMALDGRRRLFGFRHLLEQGLVTEDLEIAAYLCETKESIAAAAITANQARVPLKPAEIILAVRALAAKKIPVEAMARALCVDLVEARRYHAVSQVHMDVLMAFKDKLFDFDALKLVARIPSMPEQKALAKQAREQGGMRAYQIREYLDNDGLSALSSLMQFVGMDDYLAAGGRKSSDLLEEMPDTCLDADVAMRLWSEKAAPIQEAFAAKGIEVFISADEDCYQPDAFAEAPYRYNRPVEEKEAISRAEAGLSEVSDIVNAKAHSDGITPAIFLPLVGPQYDLAVAKFAPLPVRAVQIRPGRNTVLEFRFFTTYEDIRAWEQAKTAAKPAEEPKDEAPARVQDVIPERKITVETDHGGAFHQMASELAVRGFQRSLADSFSASFKFVLATMFEQVVLCRAGGSLEDRALKITFARNIGAYYQEPVQDLDADLFARLEAYRDAFAESGMRTYPWISSLAFQQLQDLMALMTAVSVWLNEPDAKFIRRTARAQIQEVAEEIDHDIRAHYMPDVGFYARCSKKQLLGYAERMGCEMDTLSALKKGPLAEYVAEQALARQWVPQVLTFDNLPVSGPEADDEAGGMVEDPDGDEAIAAEGAAVIEPADEDEALAA